MSKISSNIYIFQFEFFFRNITPTGFPEEFSLVYTLRARKLSKYAWHIIKIVDARDDAQFLITMNPKKQTLDFSLINHEGKLQTISFLNDRVSALGIIRIAHCSMYNDSTFLKLKEYLILLRK